MAPPKTKEEALLQMRTIWAAFVFSILFYAYIGEMLPAVSWLNFTGATKTFVALAFLNLLLLLIVWKKRYIRAAVTARKQPEDNNAIRKWMTCWVLMMALSESVAICGFFLRMGGKILQQSAPFYGVAFVLLTILWPRPFWPSAIAQVK